MKHGFIVVDGISFPTIETNGMLMVEYPSTPIKKPTEKELFKKMNDFYKEMKQKYNLKIEL